MPYQRGEIVLVPSYWRRLPNSDMIGVDRCPGRRAGLVTRVAAITRAAPSWAAKCG